MIATRYVITLLLIAPTAAGQQHEHHARTVEKLGTVRFPTSCSAAAQPAFDRGAALLHSFEYGSAIDAFNHTLKADASCAIAYWGIALSQWAIRSPRGSGRRR
jgi:hypothetical protein